MFCWLLPFLVKIDVVTFKVIIKNYFQDITNKQFLRQLKVPPNEQTLLHNTIWKKNISHISKKIIPR